MTNPDPKPDTVDVTVKLKRPPEGMEWKVSEFIPQREYYAGKMVTIEAVLRPIVPATVTLEGILREDAEDIAKKCGGYENSILDRLASSARAALARKPEAAKRCPNCEHDHSGGMICAFKYKGGSYQSRDAYCQHVAKWADDDKTPARHFVLEWRIR